MIRWERTRGFGFTEVYACIAGLSFLVARFVPVLSLHFPCPLKTLAHTPCATCGMTHAFVYLAHGRVLDALAWSPLGALLAGLAWTFALADAVRLAAGWPLPVPDQRLVRPLVVAGLAAMLVNWAYLVVRNA
ncbi:MAG: DUF2752 domain-containing protein [Anaeromyxobacter sp.]